MEDRSRKRPVVRHARASAGCAGPVFLVGGSGHMAVRFAPVLGGAQRGRCWWGGRSRPPAPPSAGEHVLMGTGKNSGSPAQPYACRGRGAEGFVFSSGVSYLPVRTGRTVCIASDHGDALPRQLLANGSMPDKGRNASWNGEKRFVFQRGRVAGRPSRQAAAPCRQPVSDGAVCDTKAMFRKLLPQDERWRLVVPKRRCAG